MNLPGCLSPLTHPYATNQSETSIATAKSASHPFYCIKILALPRGTSVPAIVTQTELNDRAIIILSIRKLATLFPTLPHVEQEVLPPRITPPAHKTATPKSDRKPHDNPPAHTAQTLQSLSFTRIFQAVHDLLAGTP